MYSPTHLQQTASAARRDRPRLRSVGALLAAVLLATGLVTGTEAQPANAAMAPVLLGAVGEAAALSASIGQPLAKHSYSHFDKPVPAGQMISVKANGTWAATASVAPGSALHADIVRYAQALKARPGRTLFAFNHEPEAAGNTYRGTSEDFIRAWRKVVDIFRSQGVTNVDYTLQMTAWSFRAPTFDARHISHWYPGDAYVDIVGADAYNWSTCGHGNGKWMELQTLTDPVLAFAGTRGKKAALPEFAAHRDARRAQWLTNANQYLTANRDSIVAAFYFQQSPTNSANSECVWKLDGAPEFKAFGDMAGTTAVFRHY